MNNRTRRVMLGLTSLGLAASIAIPVFAAESETPSHRQAFPHQQMIQALAQRFNINQGELESFFKTQHAQRMTEHLNQKLSEAVTKGKITEAQKIAIIAKTKEVMTTVQGFESLTAEQRAEKMKQLRTELQAWASQQGLDPSWLHRMVGGGMKGSQEGRGMGQREGRGMKGHVGMGGGRR